LWNALKKQDFPVLDSPGRAQLALGGAKRQLQEKTCTSEDQKLAAGCIIYRKLGAKMEISGQVPGDGGSGSARQIAFRQ
jgi:hypothetical protein